MAFETVNLAQIYGAVDRDKANRMQMQNMQLQQERYQRQNQIEDAEYADKLRFKDIYRNNISPEGKLNEEGLISGLYQGGFPEKALDYQEKTGKMKAEGRKSDLEYKKGLASYFRDRLSTVTDDASYQQVLQEARELGAGFVANAPAQFDPNWLAANVRDAEKFLEQSTPKWEKVDLGGKVQMVDVNPFTNPSIKGTSLDKTMTPDQIESNDIARQNLNLSRERFNFDKEEAQSGAKAPPGYRFAANGNLEAIPGGPADIKAGELGQKAEMRRQSNLGQTENVISTVDDALKNAGFFETGLTGSVMGAIPATDAYNLRRTVETIKANLGFQQLQAMREASPTGGALGQVAVQELNALQSTIANLDPNQKPAQLKKNLQKVRDHMNKWRETLGAAPIPQQQEVKAPEIGEVMDGYVFRGGDPADPNSWKRK